MSSKILVPELSESISEATVGRWLKGEGDPVREGEAVVELSTDKVDLEVGADANGVLAKVERKAGDTVSPGDVLGVIEDRAEEPPEREAESDETLVETREEAQKEKARLGPESRRKASKKAAAPAKPFDAPKPPKPPNEEAKATEPAPPPPRVSSGSTDGERPEERERLSARRRTIAQRLVEAQRTAAILTTFNEVDMKSVLSLRERYGVEFENKHGVRLGIVSFFVKASVTALKSFPRINSELEGDELILKKYYDVGIAVADPKGLVVPIIRNADRLSLAEIEKAIDDLASRARMGSLSIEELRGGTFTVSNGGVFGSLFSTPILNPPQVAILGLHRIEERPVVKNHEIVARPMMYVALSYDHRVVDGQEAVQFLVRVKQFVESPESMLLEP